MGRKKGFMIGEFTIGKTRNVFYPTAKVFSDANATERWGCSHACPQSHDGLGGFADRALSHIFVGRQYYWILLTAQK